MEAAYVEQLGPPDNIRYGTLPTPEPGPDEVLVNVLATTVNPVDTFVRSGSFRTEVVLPLVLSRDLVGTVATSACGFTAGELVWSNSLGHGGRQGAASSQAVVPADRLYRLPSSVDPISAVAVVHPAATAYLALHTHGLLRPASRVMVVGGSGNVGSAAVSMAVSSGATVYTTASSRDLAYCHNLGAVAIDYRNPQWPEDIDLVIECAGVNDLPTLIGTLAPRGRIVVLAGAATRPVLPIGPFYLNDHSLAGFVISHATVQELAEAAAEINCLLPNLRPRTVEELPLSEAANTHHRMEKGELHGRRVVLRP
jgi:NADPH:quinone reductase-like Zn-dependent oxidoreductase